MLAFQQKIVKLAYYLIHRIDNTARRPIIRPHIQRRHMSRAEENFLTISWNKTTGSGAQVEGGYAEIKHKTDIGFVMYRLKGLSYVPQDLRVYEMEKGHIRKEQTLHQECGVPDNLEEILRQKLDEILAMPGVAVGLTAAI